MIYEFEMSLQYNSKPEGKRQNHKVMLPNGKCTQVGMFEIKCAFLLEKKREILQCRNKKWRQPNIWIDKQWCKNNNTLFWQRDTVMSKAIIYSASNGIY